MHREDAKEFDLAIIWLVCNVPPALATEEADVNYVECLYKDGKGHKSF